MALTTKPTSYGQRWPVKGMMNPEYDQTIRLSVATSYRAGIVHGRERLPMRRDRTSHVGPTHLGGSLCIWTPSPRVGGDLGSGPVTRIPRLARLVVTFACTFLSILCTLLTSKRSAPWSSVVAVGRGRVA